MKRVAIVLGMAITCLVAVTVAWQLSAKSFYGRLSFGPEGKVQVLVTRKGDSITFEQVEGDQERKVQQFDQLEDCKGLTFDGPDGKTSYTIRSVTDLGLEATLGAGMEVEVEVKGSPAFVQAGRIRMALRPEKAATVRFHAPFTIGVAENMKGTVLRTLAWQPPAKLELVRGDKPTELYVTVRNETREADVYTVVVTTDETGRKCLFPVGIRPVVEVEFSPARAGGQSVWKRYPLDGFC